MGAIKLLILTALCYTTYAVHFELPTSRTTIFGDEMLEGEIFEDLINRNTITGFNINPSEYRLPRTTRPVEYDLLLHVHMERLAFNGTVTIYLHATQPNVSEIIIHTDELWIESVILKKDNVSIPQSFVEEEELDFLRVQLTNGTLEYSDEDIMYELIVNFGAELRHDMTGLYRSWFRNENYTEPVSYVATTHFQATAARRAFPCYDEPGFKAKFNIVIRRPSSYRSWTCTKQSSTREPSIPIANYEEDVFAVTPVMSTYLLAFTIAEYNSTEVYDDDGRLLYEVIARPAAIRDNQQQYALDFGQKLLRRMSDHVGIDFYDIDKNLKMTQASISDFAAGAMENWGLLIYREAYLMYNANHTNSNYKQLIAYIMSHEIAHMWFGNLVTCDWWNDLWLNEGFARYYQYFLTDWEDHELGFDQRFINEQVHATLLADSVESAHPLTASGIGSPTQARSMFTTITYGKGATIIRMTEHLLGFDVHTQGLKYYLDSRQFNTVLPIHLSEALQRAAVEAGAIVEYGPDFSVIEYYKTWSTQGGHPVLNVQVNHQTGQMIVVQRRFNINVGYGTASTNWIIPITFATADDPDFNNTKPTHIITDSITVIDRGSIGDQWVIFNKQQTGYYRVNYDNYTWDLIAIALKTNRTIIHEYNRAQIVNDVFQFARSGLMEYKRALNILSFLENETEYTPWVTAMTAFTWLRNRFASTPYLADLERLIIDWSRNIMADLTYDPQDGESFMRSYLRSQLAPIMCAMNVTECQEAAIGEFNLLRNNETYEVPVDSRNWVYCNALRKGSEDDFEYLWQRYKSHHVYNEKILLLSVLGCTPHRNSLYTYMDAIVTENYLIRRQDYTTAFNSAVSGNEVNTQIAFQYIKDNLTLVDNAFVVRSTLATPLSYVSARLRSEEEINEFEQWARDNRVALGVHYNEIMSGATSARNSLNWVLAAQDDVLDYLINKGDDITTTTAASTTTSTVSTVTADIVVAPPTPELPDSAVTTALSLVLLTLSFCVNVMF
ncbi:membrane alanyl aminopeptidase-like [Achroia grisella]|uniref:membrane alanyl aminopeptidase-like n=1 Tax=Achroia grisella TaxID=688607 RepID=UPI0027D2DD54|nr:membrane alanyl aminopeptidase-like [Achroia grisella]